MTEQVCLNVVTAARTIGVGKSTMWGLIQSGKITPVRIGRRTLIRRSDLDRFVEGALTASQEGAR
jgi:excisionase family DNA binding protein